VKPLSGESRTTKWTQHLGTQNEALKEWGCSEDTFIETLEKLFEECNAVAHPVFNSEEGVKIPFNMFKINQFKIIGFTRIWDKWSLPLNKFKITYSYKPPDTIEVFKKDTCLSEVRMK
jgi:hypothetical protein